MSLAVKRPLAVPGTLARLRWGAALTVPGAPVAWPRWGTRVGVISHPLRALEHILSTLNSGGSVPALLEFSKFQ